MDNNSLNIDEQPKGLSIPDGTHYKTALKIYKEYCRNVHSGGTLYSNNENGIQNNWGIDFNSIDNRKMKAQMRIKGCDCKVTIFNKEGRFLTSVWDSWDSISEAISDVCSRKNIKYPHFYEFQIVNLTESQIAYYKVSENLKIRRLS